MQGCNSLKASQMGHSVMVSLGVHPYQPILHSTSLF